MWINLLIGFLMGFASSIPPGPSSHVLIGHASTHQRRKVIADILGILAAELVVILSIFSFITWIEEWTKSGIPQLIAAIFLGGSLFYLSKPIRARRGNTFFLSLMNPGLWVSFLSFMIIAKSLLDLEFSESIYFLAAIEFGGMFWFSMIAIISVRMTKKIRSRLMKLSYFGILAMAILLSISGIQKVFASI